MMLPYPNKIQDFWVFVACSLLQKLIPTALNMEPPTVAAFVGHVSCAKKNSDMFQLAAIPAPDSENVWLPTFHDLADRIIRVVTLLKKTRLKTHDFFASKMPCIGRNGLRPGRKRGGNPKNHGVTCKAVPVWDGKMTNFQGMFGKIVILAWEIQGFVTCKSF